MFLNARVYFYCVFIQCLFDKFSVVFFFVCKIITKIKLKYCIHDERKIPNIFINSQFCCSLYIAKKYYIFVVKIFVMIGGLHPNNKITEQKFPGIFLGNFPQTESCHF